MVHTAQFTETLLIAAIRLRAFGVLGASNVVPVLESGYGD